MFLLKSDIKTVCSNRCGGRVWFVTQLQGRVVQEFQGQCQGRLAETAASHHLIIPLLFYAVGHWDLCVCGDEQY